MPAHQLKYSVLEGRFAICRLAADAAIPAWASASKFFSFTRTANGFSVVCEESRVPPGIQAEGNWVCIQLQGPFPFEMTGVLAAILDPLAAAEIGIFAISTFDTDCILIKSDHVQTAEETLQRAGHHRIR